MERENNSLEVEESAEILQSYPGIILVSQKPLTWQGFLIADSNLGVSIDIKLVVPDYPRLTDASIFFGESISLLHGMNFPEKIYRILENTNTVSSLLFQIKRVVMNLLKEKFGTSMKEISIFPGNVIDEIKSALAMNSPVDLLASNGLKTFKLTFNNINVTMRRNHSSNSWKIIESDLPQVPCIEPFDQNITSLSSAMTKLEAQVNMFQNAWDQLHDIDAFCWVVDPLQPKPYHLYRRINVTPSLSALITIDPVHVHELPDIKLLGSTVEVEKYRDIMNSNLLEWDEERTMTDNLKAVLAIDEWLEPPRNDKTKDDNVMVEDDECCICFARELEEYEPPLLPVEICNNEKCKKQFHTPCLQQWLQSVPVNEAFFGRIHGKCPNCSEDISCLLPTG